MFYHHDEGASQAVTQQVCIGDAICRAFKPSSRSRGSVGWPWNSIQLMKLIQEILKWLVSIGLINHKRIVDQFHIDFIVPETKVFNRQNWSGSRSRNDSVDKVFSILSLAIVCNQNALGAFDTGDKAVKTGIASVSA